MKKIYLDNSATTKIDDAVLQEMLPYLQENYGNPSSIYSLGRESKKALENARHQVADLVGAEAKEIYFTSGGTEANNWALRAVCEQNKNKGKHLITTKIEHHAILHTCEYLEKNGFEVTYLDVNPDGSLSLENLKNAITNETILITIMFANNEIGIINNIKEIGKIARQNGIIFHTDAVQAVGKIPFDVNEFNIDIMSMSSHKIYGPKGVGALYKNTKIILPTFIHGGAQEKRRRGGTENLAGIIGFGKACEIAKKTMIEDAKHITKLRDRLISGVLKIEKTQLNGSIENRLCSNVNVTFEYIEGESILLLLDLNGIMASSGSACTSGSLDPSHVLLAMGMSHGLAHGSIRFSIGKYNTEEEIDKVIEVLPGIIERIRSMSPLWDDYLESKK